MTDDSLPGVVLRLREATLAKTSDPKKHIVKVTLDTEVYDENVWAAVRTKLQDGIKVYSVNDFQTELLDALRKENAELERKTKTLEEAYKTAIEENRQMKLALSVLGHQIENG